MPRTHVPWNTTMLNAKLDQGLVILRTELFTKAKRLNDLSDDYIADLIRRAVWNMKHRPGETLHNRWRHPFI